MDVNKSVLEVPSGVKLFVTRGGGAEILPDAAGWLPFTGNGELRLRVSAPAGRLVIVVSIRNGRVIKLDGNHLPTQTRNVQIKVSVMTGRGSFVRKVDQHTSNLWMIDFRGGVLACYQAEVFIEENKVMLRSKKKAEGLVFRDERGLCRLVQINWSETWVEQLETILNAWLPPSIVAEFPLVDAQ
jgi:hypothetical protein